MPETAIDLATLEAMSQAQLDELFRQSPAGDIPDGQADGTVLVAPGTELTGIAAKLIHLLGWKGKVFHRDRGELENRVLLTGIQAVQAKVYKDASWFDGQECIVLDYSHTSLIAHWIRDEMRLVAPNLYLGIVFWDHAKLIDFVLQFSAASEG